MGLFNYIKKVLGKPTPKPPTPPKSPPPVVKEPVQKVPTSTLTKKMVLEVAHHEGLVRQAYKDSVGVWTWSVGITNASGHNVERYIDNPASLERCLEVWVWLLEQYMEDVDKAFTMPLTEAQRAAALSFHWNTGAIHKATWVKDFNRGDMKAAYNNIMNWKNPPEIIPRRKAERELFFNNTWSGRGTMTEYTKVSSRHTPVWSSAKKIEVDDTLDRLLK